MNESCSGQPDAEKDGDQLHEPDAVARAQNVGVLQNVWNGHQSDCAQKPQTCHPDTMARQTDRLA